MCDTHAPAAPNHHADHPGFSGVTGALTGLAFAFGRGRAANRIADLAEVSPGDRVVDIGCGPGNAVKAAARRGAFAVGVDPAPVMLRLARLLVRERNVAWHQGTAEALPLPDEGATVVWSVATIHHWQDVDQGLREVHRVLEPGGRFLGVERRSAPGATGIASHGWTDEQAEAFAEACRATGFVDVTVESQQGDRGRELVVRATRQPSSSA
jgi:ubiquinone/menaquinone biosynthesis C-methylase UbiE